jgi:hypothetical protein
MYIHTLVNQSVCVYVYIDMDFVGKMYSSYAQIIIYI